MAARGAGARTHYSRESTQVSTLSGIPHVAQIILNETDCSLLATHASFFVADHEELKQSYSPQRLVITRGKVILMRKLVLSAAVLGIFSFGAQAADVGAPAPAPIVAPAPSWAGFYIGLNAGGAFGTSGRQTSTVFATPGYFAATSVPVIGGIGQQSRSANGFTGGGQVGYNWQWSNIVAGIETDFQYFGQNSTATNSAVYPCCAPTTFTIQSRVSTNWLWTIRPRVGTLILPNLLFYITGGFALTNLHGNFLFTDTFANALETASFSSTRAGYTLGLGAEYAVAPNWTVRFEYLYLNFGRASAASSNLTAFTPAVSFPTNTFTHGANLTSNVVRFGVNYVFNTGPSSRWW
jgi:outer membrane immunogenic protein